MARDFDRVVAVFNPNSTGNAEQCARHLARKLTVRAPDLPVQVQPARYAGHARELARAAATTGRPLIVSVSGDGGYNEVVNGIMAAGTGTAVAAVLGAGNANDHRRATRQHPLIDSIVTGHTRDLDLLMLTVGDPADPGTTEPSAAAEGGAVIRYAHSYLGLGITPFVAGALDRGGKGALARGLHHPEDTGPIPPRRDRH